MDDTDNTGDPEKDGLDFEGWKLRELMRIRRDREASHLRSAERAEVEARRALPEALRLKEDTEHAASLRAAKSANRGSANFLQKYHHKGAFYADDEILQRYDFTAPTEGAVKSVESLPGVMQVRNYGKMGRTKYTHLKDQDTSDRLAGWDSGGKVRDGGGAYGGKGCFACGSEGHVSSLFFFFLFSVILVVFLL